jgi:YD repeat-containing protein
MRNGWPIIVAIAFAALAAGAASAATAYTYDTLGRIATVTYDSGKEIVYTYDAAGNRTQVVTQTTP